MTAAAGANGIAGVAPEVGSVAASTAASSAGRCARTPHPPDATQEDDDRDDRRGHEQEDELFAVQLDFVKAVVRRHLLVMPFQEGRGPLGCRGLSL